MKKIISRLLFPVMLVLELAALGFVLRRWTRFKRLGAALMIAAVLLLGAMSTPMLPHALMRGLENRYPPLAEIDDAADSDILILGQALWPNDTLPANLRVNSVFLARITEGVRIQQMLPDSRILLSIGSMIDAATAARFVSDLTAFLSVDPERVIVLRGARDTREELIMAHELLRTSRVILVTSASHIPRAMHLAERQGLQPVAAPCDYMVRPAPVSKTRYRIWQLIPNAENLRIMERVLYEYLGLLQGRPGRRP